MVVEGSLTHTAMTNTRNSLASDLMDFEARVQYEVSIRREEISVFPNNLAYLTVYGDAKESETENNC
jgi:hypothetical protein